MLGPPRKNTLSEIESEGILVLFIVAATCKQKILKGHWPLGPPKPAPALLANR